MKKVLVCLAEGFEEIEAISIVDVLRRAEIEVVTISVTGNRQVEGSHAINILADQLMEECDFNKFDMLILPGGMPGTQNLRKHEGLRKKIHAFNNEGKSLGAICAAPMILGELGILANRNVTCYPGYQQYLQGAQIKSASVVEDEHIITGSGAGVAIQFALKIVEKIRSKDVADMIAKKMMMPE